MREISCAALWHQDDIHIHPVRSGLAVISFREIESPNRMLSDGIMSDLRPKAYEMCVEVVLNQCIVPTGERY